MLGVQYIPKLCQLLNFVQLGLIVSILSTVYSQSYPVWISPPQMHTASHQIITQSALQSSSYFETDITYPTDQIFSNFPFVAVSLIGFEQLPLDLRFHLGLALRTIQSTKFTMSLSLQDKQSGLPISDRITKITINYISYNRILYNGISIHQIYTTIQKIHNLTNPRTEVHQLSYLQSLASSDSAKYKISANLFAFEMKNYSPATNYPYLQITTSFKNKNSYSLKIITGKSTQIYNQVGYNRILIDIESITGKNVGVDKDDYRVQIGIINHYSDPAKTVSVSGIAYFVDAEFFGLSMFQNRLIDLSSRSSIFSQISDSNQRINIDIQYLVIKYRDCPSSSPAYSSTQGVCFIKCSPYFYNAAATSCVACHSTCYTCISSDITGCTACVQGWHRQLNNPTASNDRCVCGQGYYQPSSGITHICKSCSQAIQGCFRCSSDTVCTQCLKSGFCSLISPNNCNCTNAGLPVCSKTNQRYDLVRKKCLCLNQFFYNQTSDQCQPCADPCFKCQFNDTFCFQCIQGYILLNNDCSFYQYSQFIIKGITSYQKESSRCISHSQDGNCFQQCLNGVNNLFYNSSCFSVCPTGTFAISHPQHLCHLCPVSCVQCTSSYQCTKCPTYFFYLDQETFTCVHCEYGCAICVNSTYCVDCQESKSPKINATTYTSTCIQTFQPLTNNSCPIGCSFCFIGNLCEKCLENYFLTTDFQCIQCSSQKGLKLVSMETSVQLDGYYSIYQKCIQVCGDGILINDQCDDGNIRSGDGCSKQCQIEQGFICQYIQIKNEQNSIISQYSLCYSNNYQITYNIFRSLSNNSIIVQLEGNGIQVEKLPKLKPKCSFIFQKTQMFQLSSQKIRYIIEYSEQLLKDSGQLHYCQFLYQNITNITFSIVTFPNIALVDFESPILSITSQLFTYLGKISIYATILLTAIGFTPYNIWVMLYSINLYGLSMYNSYNQPASVYISQDTFKYFLFSYDYHKEGTTIWPETPTLSWALLKILIYFLTMVLLYELVVGFLLGKTVKVQQKVLSSSEQNQQSKLQKLQKSKQSTTPINHKIKSSKLLYTIQRIRQNRFLLYYSIHSSYQLVANFFILHVFSDMLDWIYSTVNGVNQQQFNYLGVIAGSLHILISIIMPIVVYILICNRKLQSLGFKNNMNSHDQKFLLLFTFCKAINIFFPLSIFLSSQQTSNSSYMLLWTILIIISLLSINCKSQNQCLNQNSKQKYEQFKKSAGATQQLFRNIANKSKQTANEQSLKYQQQNQKVVVEKLNERFYLLTNLHAGLMMLVLLIISLTQSLNNFSLGNNSSIAKSLFIQISSISGNINLVLSLFLISSNWIICLGFLIYKVRIWIQQKKQLYGDKQQQGLSYRKKNHFQAKKWNQKSSDENLSVDNTQNLIKQDSKENFIFRDSQEFQNAIDQIPIIPTRAKRLKNQTIKRDNDPSKRMLSRQKNQSVLQSQRKYASIHKDHIPNPNNKNQSALTFQKLKRLNKNK